MLAARRIRNGDPSQPIVERHRTKEIIATRYKRGKALELARSWTATYPREAFAFNSLGSAFIRLGRFEQSVQPFRDAIRLDPRFVPAYANLRPRASAEFVQLDGLQWPIYLRGQAYLQLNDGPAAGAEFQSILDPPRRGSGLDAVVRLPISDSRERRRWPTTRNEPARRTKPSSPSGMTPIRTCSR